MPTVFPACMMPDGAQPCDAYTKLREALEAIAGFGSVDLRGEYEHGLRDIIRSMTDCARDALRNN